MCLAKKSTDRLKYEIADELGLLDKINRTGWSSLTSSEAGKIGAVVRNRINGDHLKI